MGVRPEDRRCTLVRLDNNFINGTAKSFISDKGSLFAGDKIRRTGLISNTMLIREPTKSAQLQSPPYRMAILLTNDRQLNCFSLVFNNVVNASGVVWFCKAFGKPSKQDCPHKCASRNGATTQRLIFNTLRVSKSR